MMRFITLLLCCLFALPVFAQEVKKVEPETKAEIKAEAKEAEEAPTSTSEQPSSQASEPKRSNVEDRPVQQGVFVDRACEKKRANGDDDDAAFNPCRCEADVVVPQIYNLPNTRAQYKINEVLMRLAGEQRCKGEMLPDVAENGGDEDADNTPDVQESSNQLSTSYEVTYQNDDLLSIVFSRYQYTGGAHGMTDITAVIFNLHSGDLYAPSDVFGSGRGREKVLNREIMKQLRELPEGEVFEETLSARSPSFVKDGACQSCTVALTDEGVSLMFQLYAVGPYSSGNVDAIIPPRLIVDPMIRKVVE